jgi:uncharacterized protein (TIGR02118 family)
MVKFMILFRKPKDIGAFENSYNDFLALVERMPDIIRRQVVDVFGSPQGEAPFYRLLEVYFDSPETMQTSLRSPAGQEAGKQLAGFPAKSTEMMFAEVYEENGGQTDTGAIG